MATTVRFGSWTNDNNTGSTITQEYQAPAYAATLSIVPTQQMTLLAPGQLTGALTVNVGVGTATTPPNVGDSLEMLFGSDASSRTVTFGTGLAVTASTLVIPGTKYGTINFTFNGTIWVEICRSITV